MITIYDLGIKFVGYSNQIKSKIILKVNKLFFLGVVIAIFTALLDLASKRAIFAILENSGGLHPEIKITSFFSLVMVWNRGVSFGMFNSIENAWFLLSLLQFSIALILFFWLYRNDKVHITWALGLIIGGALGNLCDRIRNGAVADFLDFYIGSYHWPAFNLADSVVFIGVTILIFEDLIFKKK